MEDDGILTVIGVDSRGSKQECAAGQEIYTEVSWFIDWFEQAMKDYP